MKDIPKIDSVSVEAYSVPTDYPEADGTFSWSSTTIVVVETAAGGKKGIGYSYTDDSAATLIRSLLAGIMIGRNAVNIPGCWLAMLQAVRNMGRDGIAATAISAVDNSLWDLKGKLLEVSLSRLLGQARDSVEAYGSGGFTSYPFQRLRTQLAGWAAQGVKAVKMKVGSEAALDPARVKAAREAIGPDVSLFVDANGAYSRKQALNLANAFADMGVTWFEEPVSSDDLQGLNLIRNRAPAGMDITAGEYGYNSFYFERMIQAQAVDILQADATRCCGITGFIQAAAICQANSIPLSAHCAPTLHAAVCSSLPAVRNIEYFHDHARIESMFFDGAAAPDNGMLRPDVSRDGLGIELKRPDVERFAA